jgi:NADH-quinone oxidoreductase subunit N
MGAIITLSLLAILVLYLGLFKAKKLLLPVSILGLIGAAVFFLTLWNEPAQPLYSGMVLFDHFSVVFSVLMIGLTVLVFLLSRDYFDFVGEHTAEYLALMLFSLTGALLIVSFYNLSMLFIGVEIMSVALYILAGIRKNDYASNEASLKYFLMGAFSTGFLLFGIALVYGATASFSLEEIQQYVLANPSDISPLFYTGVILLIIGLAFKVGAAPFHFWVPDVYDGSPILITTFMSTIVKVAAVAAFLRLFWFCFEPLGDFWIPLLSVLSIVTLFVGNITALMQQSFKRMLAYSSISHVGYMLFALLSLGGGSANAILIYGGAYSLSSIVAFAALIAVKRSDGSEQFEAFHGLARKNPFLSFTLAVAMLSLAGIPLTAGFVGKFMMFAAALNNYHLVLLIVAVVNAGIGIYYYFRVIVAMYFRPMEREVVPVNLNYKVVITLATLLTILLGIYPAIVTGIV